MTLTTTTTAATVPPTAAVIDTMRDCGPEGCALDWLSSKRHETPLDVRGFTRWAMQKGWGDGLPLVPPTEELVREFLAVGGWYPDEVIAVLPPNKADCTVEKIAINAVMAGAPPESLSLLCASIQAMAKPGFDLAGLNATTGSVVPAIFVNGPIRHTLDIPFKGGCFGGQAGPAPAIGRALRLVMRNVAGQHIGTTSQSVFGSPGRVAGIVLGEWEENSPWAPLAERRGVAGNAVTCYGAMGTMNILDITGQNGLDFLQVIGMSMAEPGANGYTPAMPCGEMCVAINPVWARIIGKDFPDIQDVQQLIWEQSCLPLERFWPKLRADLEQSDRVLPNGLVPLVATPAEVLVMVCGGMGSLHAMGVHSWGSCMSQTVPVRG